MIVKGLRVKEQWSASLERKVLHNPVPEGQRRVIWGLMEISIIFAYITISSPLNFYMNSLVESVVIKELCYGLRDKYYVK